MPGSGGNKPRITRTPAPYLQIAQAIRDDIYSGTLRPGDPVPSVRQVAHDYGVSLATADKAMAALRSEGIVVAQAGVGTKVAEPIPVVQSGSARFRRLARGGNNTRVGERSEVMSAELDRAPEDVANALDVEPDALVIRRDRHFHDESGLYALSTSWMPGEFAELVPALLETESIPGGTISAIATGTGRKASAGLDSAYAKNSSAEEAQALGLNEGDAVLVVETRLCDADGGALEFGVDVIRPGRRWPVSYELGEA